MTKAEAQRLINRLGALKYNNLNNAVVMKEWIRAVISFQPDKAETAITYFVDEFDECPTIREFVDYYKSLLAERTQKHKRTEQKTDTSCWVCMDKGYHLFDLTDGESHETYEYTAYCDQCEAGTAQHYDGRDMTGDHYSKYYTPGISQVMPVEWLTEQNKAKYGQLNKQKTIDRSKIREALGKIKGLEKEDQPWWEDG